MNNPFFSFWMAGFECTDKLNAFGNRVDFIKETGHLDAIDSDYQLLDTFGMRTVREGLRWSQVEQSPYEYNWADTIQMVKAAAKAQVQIVWDLCHFGYPDDLTPLHPMFAARFAAFARAFVIMYREMEPNLTLIVTPINEVGFISWLGGEVAGTSPYCHNNGWAVKCQLMKAYIEAIRQMKVIDPYLRIMTTEPLVNILPAPFADELETAAAQSANEHQFQVLDILAGKSCPELGGDPSFLDIIGVNYYFPNQWFHITNERLQWRQPEQQGGRRLNELLKNIYQRYQRPVVLSETSYPADERDEWIAMIGNECSETLKAGIPLWGICWYPIIDRPDWDHLTPWHNSGLWDNDAVPGQKPNRILHQSSAIALRIQQEFFRENHLQQSVNAEGSAHS
ncbi:MAG: amine oxidase [Chitinophagaceae bacterium]|nr:MAG: amine oxidase [Chitinophagaceae bacterium]